MQNNIHIHSSIPSTSEDGLSSSDWISCVALLISICTIILTYRSLLMAKKMDIKVAKFERLCFQNVEKIFVPIDNIFTDKSNEDIGNYKAIFTDIITELNLFFVEISDVYKKIDLNNIGIILEEFSDKAYLQENTTPVSSMKSTYYSTKTKLYDHLFDFVMDKGLVSKT